jgi:hypothetical protein
VTAVPEQLRRTFRDAPACRIATVGPSGAPHVVPRWFVWTEDGLFVSTRRGDATWEHADADPRVSVLIDRGRDWLELAGIRVDGSAELLPAEDPRVRKPMSTWHEKYRSFVAAEGFERLTEQVPELGLILVRPTSLDAWDHRIG